MVNHECLSPLFPQDAVYRQCGIDRIDPPVEFEQGSPREFVITTRQTYPFTTENIAGYIGDLCLPIHGSRIAAVSGSADFPINAYLFGAAKVDAVDISPVACLFGELKLAGLRTFSYEEFLAFFATTERSIFGPSSFSHEQYQRIRGQLSETARNFFDQVIAPEGNHPFLRPKAMLITKIWDMEVLRRMNPYLRSEELYEKAKRAVEPTLFYPQDIRAFLKGRTEQYDVVYLSNVTNYIRRGRDPITVAKSALVLGGVVMTLSLGYPRMTAETQWDVKSRQREYEKQYKMGGFFILADRGYEADSNPHGSIVVFVLQKKPSLFDRLRRREHKPTDYEPTDVIYITEM